MSVASTAAAAGFGLGLAIALMTAVWLGSLVRRDASLVDRFWGAGFVVLAAFYVLSAPAGAEAPLRAVALVLTAVWGMRLSVYLTRRNWGRGEDYRYAEMRARHGARFPFVSLFTVFLLQAVLLWLIAFPLLVAGRAPAADLPLLILGTVVWAIGFVVEVTADAQLARFRAQSSSRGPLDRGLWRYSRHPNYFGEAVLWWGIWLVAAASAGAWTVFSPVLITFLLVRVSGVALLEKRLRTSRPGWEEYAARTSAFVPRPPRRRAPTAGGADAG
jgi:steroid 5-alpha reductase family enzyme